MEELTKDFYTVGELVHAKWFPVKSDATIKKLAENGMLKAVDTSANSKYRRYKITKESIIGFMVYCDENKAKKL